MGEGRKGKVMKENYEALMQKNKAEKKDEKNTDERQRKV